VGEASQDPVLGWIELRGLRCPARHGGLAPDESDLLLLVDVSVAMDLAPVSRSDAYADAVDLAVLADVVRTTVAQPPRLLLETVAVQAARQVLAAFPLARQVRLRVARPEPTGLGVAEEAISLTLSRD
jgi:dihydroneopterin aldolase